MSKWKRVCCYCNELIEGHAHKVGKCENDGVVFWAHPDCARSRVDDK